MERGAAFDGTVSRGRPATDENRHVALDLMNAVERALGAKTSKEITVREIAAAAGTNEAMVKYYFGGKDGLMVAIFDDMMRRAPHQRKERISQECVLRRSIGPLAKELCEFYYSRPNLIRMTMVEMICGSSAVKNAYIHRYDKTAPLLVRGIIEDLQRVGVYRSDINLKFSAMSLMGAVLAPITSTRTMAALEEEVDIFTDESWVEHLTMCTDNALR